ncbi:MAG: ZIP family metal transporter [Clostridiales bacterium]|jgi:ZIP family zinc transporter|nr:ZIP family metal transporter [Clostridiales bacterium]
MKDMLRFALIGYLTAWSGFFLGSLASILMKKRGARFLGSMMGFTAGLLISFICFEMLPSSFAQWGIYKGIAAMLLGVFVSAWLEGRMNNLSRWHKAGLLLTLGVSIHNLPEGMALGSMLNVSYASGISLAIMITIHCFPEALAVALPLRQAGVSAFKLLASAFILALPMGLGTMGGAFFSTLSPRFIDACVCFSGGVMLYIACGEILPESKEIWNGRMPALGAMIGFVIGVMLTERL